MFDHIYHGKIAMRSLFIYRFWGHRKKTWLKIVWSEDGKLSDKINFFLALLRELNFIVIEQALVQCRYNSFSMWWRAKLESERQKKTIFFNFYSKRLKSSLRDERKLSNIFNMNEIIKHRWEDFDRMLFLKSFLVSCAALPF